MEKFSAKKNSKSETNCRPAETTSIFNSCRGYCFAISGPQSPAQLVDFLVEHTKKIHSSPHNDWEIIPTVGSTQSWDSCIRVFCDPGDTILVEKYAFTSAMKTAVPKGVITLTMEIDYSGIIPEMLEEKLAKIKSSGAKLPKLIYTV
ncbi:hypothetical protein DASC09_007850 [Saccharomycopsis crataegensis]|uniref:Aminotransferase class I/classII domain-containing protein n=1 Tax=Saccharomycopsis crataegensis TaxID=43959 RepID=A0AAV5QES6_9ASCO|nr:hypothetical protein DASC09_007850 [Saccharomycopsis crataegensis]